MQKADYWVPDESISYRYNQTIVLLPDEGKMNITQSRGGAENKGTYKSVNGPEE